MHRLFRLRIAHVSRPLTISGFRPFLRNYVTSKEFPQEGDVDWVSMFPDAEATRLRSHSLNFLSLTTNDEYWKKVPLWSETSAQEFLDYSWQTSNTVQGKDKLVDFLHKVLPETIALDESTPHELQNIRTRQDFVDDVLGGMELAPMSLRLTPHILSVVDWAKALTDPIRRQFMPMKSSIRPDHPLLKFDSLDETRDSPVPGLVHRYPDKALFLATSVCPVYCRFCMRSYSVGAPTSSASKTAFVPGRRRWDKMFDYIEKTPQLKDVLVSGGDAYYLQPQHITEIGERLLSIPHIKRFRFATKGLAVSPMRLLTDDVWTGAIIDISNKGRKLGKAISIQTHFNHPAEITWITKLAAQKLFENAVVVRNQTVLLKGVNDNVKTMKALIQGLADINILPYYVFQGNMIKGVEDLRTPLSTILNLEEQIRGTISGYMMPNFVVDLPGGGGKRIASAYESYDAEAGIAKYIAPGVAGSDSEIFEYHDPLKA